MAESTSELEQVVQAHAEMWNEQDEGRIPEVISESYVEYNPVVPGGEIRGADGFRSWFREITSAFPDFEAEILDLLAGGETAMAEVRFTMTHEGDFGGIPATGQSIELRGMGKFHIADGRVQELHNYLDARELFEQLDIPDS